jgi:hypothetical protein
MTTPTETQDQTGQTTEQDPPVDVDLFEVGADLLEKADYAELAAKVRDGYDYAETFTARRLRIIGQEDPDIAARIGKAIEDEAASKTADQARRVEQERLEGLDAQQHSEAMAALQDEAATAAHQAEIDTFLSHGGIAKARALADAVASKETSAAEAMTAWDSATDVEREVASSVFRFGVVDFDPDEVLGRGGAS